MPYTRYQRPTNSSYKNHPKMVPNTKYQIPNVECHVKYQVLKGEVLVQVLLLLRSSTHTPGIAGLSCFFSKQLTRNVQNYVSAFPEFVIHEDVRQEVEDHCYLDQLKVEVV